MPVVTSSLIRPLNNHIIRGGGGGGGGRRRKEEEEEQGDTASGLCNGHSPSVVPRLADSRGKNSFGHNKKFGGKRKFTLG